MSALLYTYAHFFVLLLLHPCLGPRAQSISPRHPRRPCLSKETVDPPLRALARNIGCLWLRKSRWRMPDPSGGQTLNAVVLPVRTQDSGGASDGLSQGKARQGEAQRFPSALVRRTCMACLPYCTAQPSSALRLT